MPGVDLLASAFNGANAAFIADQYARWAANPGAVDSSFAALFEAMDDEARGVLEDASGASWAPHAYSVAEPEPASKPGAKPALQDAKPAPVSGPIRSRSEPLAAGTRKSPPRTIST